MLNCSPERAPAADGDGRGRTWRSAGQNMKGKGQEKAQQADKKVSVGEGARGCRSRPELGEMAGSCGGVLRTNAAAWGLDSEG